MYRTQTIPGGALTLLGILALSFLIPSWTAGTLGLAAPLDLWSGREEIPHRVPAASLLKSLRDPRILAFFAVWFGFLTGHVVNNVRGIF